MIEYVKKVMLFNSESFHEKNIYVSFLFLTFLVFLNVFKPSFHFLYFTHYILYSLQNNVIFLFFIASLIVILDESISLIIFN